jgi:membrane associated rhomboid family serine protease
MFPLRDDDRGRRTKPWVTWGIIVLNVLVFALFQRFGHNDQFTLAWAAVPAEIATGHDVVTQSHVEVDPGSGQRYKVPGLQPTPIVYLTLLMSMFMHGGIAHIAGNMWFLQIFGDNVEDDMGHVRYAIFYLLTGVLASLAHVATTYLAHGDPMIPSLGASGAISGVLGGYLLMHPKNRVTVLMLRSVTDVPAIVAVGMWFVFQVISGLGILGGQESGGVAYAAHVGGFIAGLALVKLFTIGRPEQHAVASDVDRA